MTAQDTAAIVKGIAPVILQVVSAAVAPLQVKIAALEAQLAGVRNGIDGNDGAPGQDGICGVGITNAEIMKDGGLKLHLSDGSVIRPEGRVVGQPGEPGIPGVNGKDGAPGADGKDGIGLAGMLIGKDGQLVGTLSDGSMHTLGPVVGKDGEDGTNGLPGAAGANGKDGKDGTLEAIMPVLNERTLSFVFKADGSPVPDWSLKLPALIDRGIYSGEKSYESGDVVTYGGSAWICKQDCLGQQPETDAGKDYWRLAVKRGFDGKNGAKGEPGLKGKDGAPGRDGTRSY